jgi:hypothetical protein
MAVAATKAALTLALIAACAGNIRWFAQRPIA